MTAPLSIGALLAELARHEIELQAADGRLLYYPRRSVTPDLAKSLSVHREDLLSILAAADTTTPTPGDNNSAAPPPYHTPNERDLLDGCPATVLAAVDAAKHAFAGLGGLTVEAVVPFTSQARDQAARLVRDARRRGKLTRATALRDAWRERIAICALDNDVPLMEVETIALNELRTLPDGN